MNDERRLAASPTSSAFAITNNEPSNREERSDRTRPPREVPTRPVRPRIVNQPVTIALSNGQLTVDPLERDLFDNEQVEWICSEPAWEVRFDQEGISTPFEVDIFGPGLVQTAMPDNDVELPVEDAPTESGPIRDDVPEGDYDYSAQISGFGPLTARVKIIRGPRR